MAVLGPKAKRCGLALLFGFNGTSSCSHVENTDVCVCERKRETELIGVPHCQARGVVPFGNDTVPEVQQKVFNWIRQKFFCLSLSFSPSDSHSDSIGSNKPYSILLINFHM